MSRRTAFLLTGNENSERTLFSKNILEKIGFDVKCIIYLPHNDKVISNKISMLYIYGLIEKLEDNYAYIFEDDINIIKDIQLDEIIQYEKISEMFFYLGLCEPNMNGLEITNFKINDHLVYRKSGNNRGLHAIGLSKKGATELLKFSKETDFSKIIDPRFLRNYHAEGIVIISNNSVEFRYMDVILELFSLLYPANVVRYDLSSYIYGHRGIIFQDRVRFPSTIP